MRKFYSRLLLVLFSFLSMHALRAQVSAYTFAASSGTYTAISGTSPTLTGDADEGYATNIPIGFSFTYAGVDYTTVGVSSNGFLAFGTLTSANITNNLATATNGRPFVAPLWDDHDAQSASNIQYTTTGTAGSRVFTMQWSNVKWNWNAAGAVISFQAKLYEGTNVIEFVYEPLAASANNGTASIGLSAVATGSGNYLVLNNASASPTTSSTTNTTNISAKPAAGQIYTFTPPALPPVDLSVTAITGMPTSPCPNNSVPLSVTIKNSGSSSIDFATNNATININVTGASTQSLTVTLNNGTLAAGASQTYPLFPNADFSAGGTHTLTANVVITGDGNAANNSSTTPVNINYVTTSPWSESFATTTAPTGWNTTGWSIANNHGVSSNGIYRNIWASATTGVFSTITVGPVTANDILTFQYRILNWASTYPGTQVPPTGDWGNFKVQISTDCGATFTDLATINNTNHTVTDQSWTTLSYPLASYVGQNVIFRINATWVSGDYFLDFDNFNVFAACSGTPSGGAAAASTTSVCIGGSTDLSLTGATTGVGGLSYQWQSSPDGVTYTDIAGATLATYTATGITSNTYFKAIVTCANGSAFDDSDPILVTTAAPQAVPFTEGFESLTSVGPGITPGCWSTQLTTGANFTSANTAVRNGLGARTGTHYIWARWSSDAWLFTPAVQLTAGTSYDFSFWYRQTDAVNGFVLTAAVGNANNGTAMATTLGTITNPVNTAYTQAKFTYVATTTGVHYFGLRSNASGAPWYMTFDDFAVELTPPCNAPNAVTIGSLTNASASANFTATGAGYIVEYGPVGFTPGTGATAGTGGTIVTGATSPISMTGLTSNTSYDVYVRQVCGAVYSVNSPVVTFTTLCDATNVPYSENFNAATTPNIPECTQRVDLNGATTWTTVVAPTGYTGNTLQYSWDGSTPGDDWFYTRGLNLTGGTLYRLVFKYGNNSTFFEEKLKVHYGTAANAGAMTNLLVDHSSIMTGAPVFDTIMFTPAATGVYYIGFHAYSDADMFNLYLDDISVIKAPLVDVSPVAIITPPTTCPINMATVQATITNASLFTLDLTLNPVTVTANVTGAGTGTLTGTLNTGTIAPGASMNVSLSPAFNFSTGGNYTFDVTTTQVDDEITTNNNYSTVIFVNTPPTVATVTPATPTVCLGSTVQLTASGSMAGTTGTVTGTSPTTSTSSSTPFYRLFEGSRRQYMVRATELSAMGMISGSMINSLSFNVTSLSTPSNLDNFRLKVATTTATDLSASFVAGATTVFSSPSYLPVLGANTFALSTPLTWDGTSNVVFEICWDNDADNTCGAGSPVCWGNTPTMSMATAPFNATRAIYDDNTSGTRDMCALDVTDNTTVVGTSRPVIVFGFTAPSTYTWSPAATLFTDAAGTIAYTGTPTNSVYAKPTGATVYTITATSGVGCTSETTVNVNITPETSITTQPAATVSGCVGGPATFTVGAAGAGLTYQWRKNGADITGATNASYTISNLAYADAGNYSVVVTGTCAPSVTSTDAVLTVTDNSWTGTSNSDWNNAANWCGGVPTQAMSVVIPSGTPFSPSIAGNAPVNNVTIETGATLQITASGRLILHGNLTNNGTLNSTAGTFEFMGAANQSVPAITAANIIMNGAGGITLGGNMTVGTALTMTNGNITLGNNNLTFTGGSTGSVASHIVTNGTGKVTGNNIGTVTVVFPVGPTATSYNPVMIANGQGRNYTVGVVTGLPSAPALANAARAINRTWNVTASSAPTSPVNITLGYADADANASATPTANMEAGVATATNWMIATQAGGLAPTGTAAGRLLGFQTISFGPMVLANIGGINFPTAVPNVDADVTSVVLMPNVVNDLALLRVKTQRTTKVEWTVVDGNGRVVMAFSRQVFAGQNDIQLHLGRLAAGTYQLVGTTEKGRVQAVRFIRL